MNVRRLPFMPAWLALLVGCLCWPSMARKASDGADEYAVEGIVVDAQSRVPLANVHVTIAPTSARDQKLEQITKPDGRFSFSSVVEGKYSLRISRPGYPPQGYKQAGHSNLVTAIVVRKDQDTRHLVVEARRGSAVSGQIKDEDSEPIAAGLVAIFQLEVNSGERDIVLRGEVRSNAAGGFRFRNLSPGIYYVLAMGRPWFADSLILDATVEEAQPPEDPGDPPQELPPDAVPLGSAEATAPKPAIYSPDPGFRGTAFAPTFYPNSQTLEAASPIRVEAGGETQVSITLPLSKGVALKGEISVPGELSRGKIFLRRRVQQNQLTFLEEMVPKDGRFDFQNIPAGSYEVLAMSQLPSGPSSWIIRQEVGVGASDVELHLRPSQLASLSGQVTFDRESYSRSTTLFAYLQGDTTGRLGAEVGPDGRFFFDRLPPGKYELDAGSTEFIAAYRTNQAGEHLPLTVQIAPGAPAKVDLVVSGALSIIEGIAEHAGVSQSGAFVLLLPKSASDRAVYRVDQTDSDGSFRLATIPVGDYFLIALTDGAEVAYRDSKVAEILAKVAQLIHVEGSSHLKLKLNVVAIGALNLPDH